MATTWQTISWAILIGLFSLAASSDTEIAAQETSTGEEAAGSVASVPDSVRAQFKLDPFYQKHLAVGELPIVGSANVSDAALLEAAWIVNKMLSHRPKILTAMADNNTRLAVMAFNEYTTDIPEHAHLTSRVFWDRRARGLGATPSAPAVSCAEENLLGHPGDPYAAENICIHEFAHAIHSMGMSTVDPTFDDRLKTAFETAIAKELWVNTYASGNRQEYWAEGVQSWFDDNRENDSLHNHVNTRLELKKYDPRLARLCEEVFGDNQWRYKKPLARKPQERAHLANVDFENLPQFKWRKERIPNMAKVLIQTTAGDIELELDATQAPLTVANFLHYVHQGFYSNGEFHRAVTADNQPQNKIKIAVIQGAADPKQKANFDTPIPLERTRDTGLKHLDGTISMAREADPDTGKDHFFICVGDQPELDFGGKRNPDGQGFAAFGQVTKGMDVVKKIHQSNSEEQTLTPKIKIQRAVRLN